MRTMELSAVESAYKLARLVGVVPEEELHEANARIEQLEAMCLWLADHNRESGSCDFYAPSVEEFVEEARQAVSE